MFESISQYIPGGNNKNYIKALGSTQGPGTCRIEQKGTKYLTLTFGIRMRKLKKIVQNDDTEISLRGHGQL